MNLKLVPVHSDALEGTTGVWFPFVEQIAQRSRCSVGQLVTEVLSNAVHILLIWDHDAKEAKALVGTRNIPRGDNLVCEIVWAVGTDGPQCFGLFDEIEQYHREHFGCVGMKAICRPGWKKMLKSKGYRVTHLVMERDF